MTNKLVPVNSPVLSENDIQEQVNVIQRLMKKIMQKDVHYGVIPGCGNKPALLKPGSEKILSTFRIAVDPVVEDLSTDDEVKYRILARGVNWQTGTYLGSGVGVASSDEEKYKWKKASCKEEYDETPENRKRIKYGRDQRGQSLKIFQVRQNPADVANTILKMAKKRAQIDMTLTVTAASDIFTQDIDETVAEEVVSAKPDVAQPKAKEVEPEEKPEPETEISPQIMFTIARDAGVPQAKIKAMMKKCYKKETTDKLTVNELKELVEWIESGEANGK